MAHKMDGLRRIFKFNLPDREPTLEARTGTLDLRDMEANGHLPRGTHIDDQGRSHPITGRVYKHKGDEYLTFTRDDGRATFLGRLIFEDLSTNPTKLIVVGTLITSTANAAQGEVQSSGEVAVTGQVEQVLVITKP